MRKLFEHKIIRITIIVILAVMAAVSVYQGIRNALVFSQDFQWDAAKSLFLRVDPYDVSMGKTDALSQDLQAFYDYYDSIDAPQRMEANQFPSLLMLLFPYTFLAQDTARIAWLITNLLCTVGIIVLLRKTFLRETDRFVFYVLVLLMLAGTPYRNQLGVGQHTLFSLFFFLLAVWLLEKKGGSIPAILCLAVSYFKYTLTGVLAIYLIYKKKWKELFCSVGIHIVLTGIAAISLQESFANMLIKPLKVSSALISEGGLDFGTLIGGSIAFIPAFLVMAGLLVLALKADTNGDGMLIAVLLLWSLIILYHRTYDFFTLVLVAGAFAGNDQWKLKGTPEGKVTVFFYGLVLFMVFFVLRLFNEADWIRIVTGTVYYGYTIWMTILFIRYYLRNKEYDQNGNGK